MKTDIQVLALEWIVTRDVLLDRYVYETAEVCYNKFFLTRVWQITSGFKGLSDGLNLENTNPYCVGSSYHIFAEIQAMYRIIDVMPVFFGDFQTAWHAFQNCNGDKNGICKSKGVYG